MRAQIKVNKKNKKAIEIEMLVYWLIAVAILVLIIVVYLILKGKGTSALEFIKSLFRFKS